LKSDRVTCDNLVEITIEEFRLKISSVIGLNAKVASRKNVDAYALTLTQKYLRASIDAAAMAR
jgi:hypothetical protein